MTRCCCQRMYLPAGMLRLLTLLCLLTLSRCFTWSGAGRWLTCASAMALSGAARQPGWAEVLTRSAVPPALPLHALGCLAMCQHAAGGWFAFILAIDLLCPALMKLPWAAPAHPPSSLHAALVAPPRTSRSRPYRTCSNPLQHLPTPVRPPLQDGAAGGRAARARLCLWPVRHVLVLPPVLRLPKTPGKRCMHLMD